jgi:hypothetical protein
MGFKRELTGIKTKKSVGRNNLAVVGFVGESKERKKPEEKKLAGHVCLFCNW